MDTFVSFYRQSRSGYPGTEAAQCNTVPTSVSVWVCWSSPVQSPLSFTLVSLFLGLVGLSESVHFVLVVRPRHYQTPSTGLRHPSSGKRDLVCDWDTAAATSSVARALVVQCQVWLVVRQDRPVQFGQSTQSSRRPVSPVQDFKKKNIKNKKCPVRLT